MKKLLLLLLLSLSFVAFSFNAFSYEGEIVVNKKGQSVLLKNDNTWEILNPSGLHNKVVFTIIDTVNLIDIRPIKDDFGDVKEKKVFAGCSYQFSVKNNTKYKVKIVHPEFSNRAVYDKLYKRSSWPEYMSWPRFSQDEPLMPGREFKSQTNWEFSAIMGNTGLSLNPNQSLTSKQETEIKEKYGCDAQTREGLQIVMGLTYGEPVVAFPSSANISRKELKYYVAGNPFGKYPIQEEMRVY
jgi:hypothetical protein